MIKKSSHRIAERSRCEGVIGEGLPRLALISIRLRATVPLVMTALLVTLLNYGVSSATDRLPTCAAALNRGVTTQTGIGLVQAKQTVLYRQNNLVIRISKINIDTFAGNEAIFEAVSHDLARRTGQNLSMLKRKDFSLDRKSFSLAYIPNSFDLPAQMEFTAFCRKAEDIIFFRGSNSQIVTDEEKLQMVETEILNYFSVLLRVLE